MTRDVAMGFAKSSTHPTKSSSCKRKRPLATECERASSYIDLRSVIAAQHALAMTVVTRRGVARRAVAHAVMRRVILPRRQAVTRRVAATRRIAVAIARTCRIAVIAGSRTVRAEVRTRPVAVDRGA